MIEALELVLWILTICALAPAFLTIAGILLVGALTAMVHVTTDRKKH